MSADNKIYRVELLCDYPEWWRYNVYVIAAGYDDEGNKITYNEVESRVCDLDYTNKKRNAPKGTQSRVVSLETDPCSYIDVYIYAVTNTFPDSAEIKNAPPFHVMLKVSVGGVGVEKAVYEVNQWGGLTVVGHRVEASADNIK